MEADSQHRPVGALIAGGSSHRMGRDKARLQLGDRPMFRWVADALGWTATRVQSGGEPLPGLGWPVVPDRLPGAGPAAAIEALLGRYPERTVVVCAVDLPLAGETLLRACWRLARERADAAIALPRRGGRWQPLAAAWTPAAREPLAAWLRAGRRDLQGLIDSLPVAPLEGEALSTCGDPDRLLMNVNRPGDLERARHMVEESG